MKKGEGSVDWSEKRALIVKKAVFSYSLKGLKLMSAVSLNRFSPRGLGIFFAYPAFMYPANRAYFEGCILDKRIFIGTITFSSAGIAQLVERNLAKVEVASSRLVSRSRAR